MPSDESLIAAPLEAGAPQIRPIGDRACIIDLPSLDAVLEMAESMRAAALDGVIDVVPASRTVLVRCRDRRSVRAAMDVARRAAAQTSGARDAGAAGRHFEVPVRYNGADLADVARLTGLSVDTVIAAHTGTPWTAAFGGFAPGFVYLTGGDEHLRVPRLDAPRTTVPTGSVAIAAEYSAVYPGASPGGWRVLGRTEVPFWDAEREPAALVAPGDTVRFRAVREAVEVVRSPVIEAPVSREIADHPEPIDTALRVLDPGLLTLVQDAGRPGFAAVGVTASGAADRSALRRANRAVGNADGAAAFETLNAALSIRAERPISVALAGTDAHVTIVDSAGAHRAVPNDCAGSGLIELAAGETLEVGAATRGLRSIVAVHGGLAVRTMLSSAAHDTLSGLGAPPVSAGQCFALGAADGTTRGAAHGADAVGPDRAAESADEAGGSETVEPAPDGACVLRFVPGPRADWFGAESLERFASGTWSLSADANRVGLRFDGAPLERASDAELPSEGTVRGEIQVPPNGQPVLFLADHPVTGGYPVIGTVVDADTDLAAQLRPGEAVRFVPVDPDALPDRREFERHPPVHRRTGAPVRFSIEVDGRRRAVSLPEPVAAALDQAWVQGQVDAVDVFAAALAAATAEAPDRR